MIFIVFLLSCKTPDPPDILLITMDATRADSLDFTSLDTHTPNLAKLAERGLVFDRAFTSVPLTLPSHTSILTGQEPISHGVRNNGTYKADDSLNLLPELLTDYSSGAVIGAFVLDKSFGLNQGFLVYDDNNMTKAQGTLFAERNATEVTNSAIKLSTELQSPNFLWVHYFDPHQPLIAPSRFSKDLDPYLAEVSYMDYEIGRLLDTFSDNTLIIVTADHGEDNGDHGEQTHGFFVHDSTIKVPLIIAGPSIKKGKSNQDARLIDIMPTILDYLGISIPENIQGHSLLKACDNVPLYAETMHPHEGFGMSPVFGFRMGDLRLVRTTQDRLFDTSKDPKEQMDISSEKPDEVKKLSLLLEDYQKTHTLKSFKPSELSKEDQDRLESLGYLWIESAEMPLDPYDSIDSIRVLSGAKPDDPQASLKIVLDLLEKQPNAPRLWELALDWSEYDSIILEKAIAAVPENLYFKAYYAWNLKTDNPEKSKLLALEILDSISSKEDSKKLSVKMLVLIGWIFNDLDLLEESTRVVSLLGNDKLVDPDLLYDRARLFHQNNHLEKAIIDYNEYLKLKPDDPAVYRNLGYALAANEEYQKAKESLLKSLLLQPEQKQVIERIKTLNQILGESHE